MTERLRANRVRATEAAEWRMRKLYGVDNVEVSFDCHGAFKEFREPA